MTNREKLKQLLINTPNCDNDCSLCEYNYTDDKCEEHLSGIMADHLLSNGVIVLPCKVGDTIYLFAKYSKSPIVKGCVDEIRIDSSSRGTWIIVMKDEYNRRIAFFEDEIGDTIFFSEEEIKAKIKGV